jgi:diketogulonate reductase-like aldo/keto reductase
VVVITTFAQFMKPNGCRGVPYVETFTLNNGVEMPALGLGVFQTPPDETRNAVRAALDAGYRHIDTAAAYGNERQVGEAVHDSDLNRSEIFLETKVWISDYGYHETLHGFQKSAGKLGVDRIDLLILHQALAQRDVQDFCAGHGILTQAWSPIGGITFYRDGSHGSTLQDPVIGGIATAHGKTPAQVMLRWGLQHGRSVIPKSTKPSRIAENINVFDFDLSTDEMTAIDGLDTGRRGGPEPDTITLEAFGRQVPEA